MDFGWRAVAEIFTYKEEIDTMEKGKRRREERMHTAPMTPHEPIRDEVTFLCARWWGTDQTRNSIFTRPGRRRQERNQNRAEVANPKSARDNTAKS
jgi:hypothetical protein